MNVGKFVDEFYFNDNCSDIVTEEMFQKQFARIEVADITVPASPHHDLLTHSFFSRLDEARLSVELNQFYEDNHFVISERNNAVMSRIAQHTGDISFDIRSLPVEIAESFAGHVGLLELDCLESLTDEATKHLIKHRGDLSLLSLENISASAAQLLADFPAQLFLNPNKFSLDIQNILSKHPSLQGRAFREITLNCSMCDHSMNLNLDPYFASGIPRNLWPFTDQSWSSLNHRQLICSNCRICLGSPTSFQ